MFFLNIRSYLKVFELYYKEKEDSPLGNCAEANLVNKIPAPSIKASRMPPIAAEPTMATGPSEDISNKDYAKGNGYPHGYLLLPFSNFFSLSKIHSQ
jgi:hypothetical protein